MRRAEAIVLMCIVAMALALMLWSVHRPGPEQLHEPALLIPASELLANRHDFLGDTSAPYTLIEFGDYECPPCRAARPAVLAVLAKHKGKVKLDFRNLPLPQIHPYAMYSAIAAEAARRRRCFWKVHDALYASELSDAVIERIARENMRPNVLSDRDMHQARHSVNIDLKLSERLGLTATPSFLMACPDGKLYSLASLESISNHVR